MSYQKLIALISNAIATLKTDASDKQEIRRLKLENETLHAELAEAKAECPTADEQAQLAGMLADFAAATSLNVSGADAESEKEEAAQPPTTEPPTTEEETGAPTPAA